MSRHLPAFAALLLALAPAARAHQRLFAGPFEDESIQAPEEEEVEADDPAEAESETAEPSAGPDVRYTADLSDAQLQRLWTGDLAALGSISVGFADQGRLINAARMPQDPAWICQRPELAWGTRETVDGLAAAFRAVRQQFPGSAPGRLSHIGLRDGGYLRPHRSHQSGRDADIGFYYKGDPASLPRWHRERLMDPARNWALVRALVTQSDVQMILVDRSIQRVLRDYALSIGEDPGFVDRIFGFRKGSIVQHARHHKDHFHVRFYAPRSMELGRRIQPLLAQRPDQNLIVHRVRRGDTLGHLARKYGTTVALIRKASHLRGSFLRLGQQLRVPLRGPCTRCPLPPAVVVPPRCLPPATSAVAAAVNAAAAPPAEKALAVTQ